jgi:hypothetical protein
MATDAADVETLGDNLVSTASFDRLSGVSSASASDRKRPPDSVTVPPRGRSLSNPTRPELIDDRTQSRATEATEALLQPTDFNGASHLPSQSSLQMRPQPSSLSLRSVVSVKRLLSKPAPPTTSSRPSSRGHRAVHAGTESISSMSSVMSSTTDLSSTPSFFGQNQSPFMAKIPRQEPRGTASRAHGRPSTAPEHSGSLLHSFASQPISASSSSGIGDSPGLDAHLAHSQPASRHLQPESPQATLSKSLPPRPSTAAPAVDRDGGRHQGRLRTLSSKASFGLRKARNLVLGASASGKVKANEGSPETVEGEPRNTTSSPNFGIRRKRAHTATAADARNAFTPPSTSNNKSGTFLATAIARTRSFANLAAGRAKPAMPEEPLPPVPPVPPCSSGASSWPLLSLPSSSISCTSSPSSSVSYRRTAMGSHRDVPTPSSVDISPLPARSRHRQQPSTASSSLTRSTTNDSSSSSIVPRVSVVDDSSEDQCGPGDRDEDVFSFTVAKPGDERRKDHVGRRANGSSIARISDEPPSIRSAAETPPPPYRPAPLSRSSRSRSSGEVTPSRASRPVHTPPAPLSPLATAKVVAVPREIARVHRRPSTAEGRLRQAFGRSVPTDEVNGMTSPRRSSSGSSTRPSRKDAYAYALDATTEEKVRGESVEEGDGEVETKEALSFSLDRPQPQRRKRERRLRRPATADDGRGHRHPLRLSSDSFRRSPPSMRPSTADGSGSVGVGSFGAKLQGRHGDDVEDEEARARREEEEKRRLKVFEDLLAQGTIKKSLTRELAR